MSPFDITESHRSPWAFCVAPMMDWTDRHCRFFHRLLAPHARLYTEMVVAQAILHGDQQRLLGFDHSEHPVALQLGGSDPKLLAQAALIGQQFGYDEINLNCGCPSDRVQSGRFGACLMLEPTLVADCMRAMQEAVAVPVTIKCRLGVDEQDDYKSFARFVDIQARAGCQVFIVHARKAWLKGLSPKENREKPPLWYDRVYRLKTERPDLTIVLNGGLETVEDCQTPLQQLDGVMLGRAAYHTPYVLAEIERQFFGMILPDRTQVISKIQRYLEDRQIPARHVNRHLLGLYQGVPGVRAWRQALTMGALPLQAMTHLESAAIAVG